MYLTRGHNSYDWQAYMYLTRGTTSTYIYIFFPLYNQISIPSLYNHTSPSPYLYNDGVQSDHIFIKYTLFTCVYHIIPCCPGVISRVTYIPHMSTLRYHILPLYGMDIVHVSLHTPRVSILRSHILPSVWHGYCPRVMPRWSFARWIRGPIQ